MMGRNRRRKKVNGYMFPAPFAGIVILVSAFALFYVWLGCSCEGLGEEIKALEKMNDEAHKRFNNESLLWARMKSPQNLEKALQRHNIEMTWPRRDQVVRLYRSPAEDENGMDENLDAYKYAKLGRVSMNE